MPSSNSRRKLKPKDLMRFQNAEPPLFGEIAKVVCQAGVLPEKELHECWQMANRIQEVFPTAETIADIAAGHGLLAWILVLLDQHSQGKAKTQRVAIALDIMRPPSSEALARAFLAHWPELHGKVLFIEGSVDAIMDSYPSRTLFVSAHGCGSVSDRVLSAAISSGVSVGILPCCHSFSGQKKSLGSLANLIGMDVPTFLADASAIDAYRESVLAEAGYSVSNAFIDKEITPQNRLILGQAPHASPSAKTSLGRTPLSPLQNKKQGEIRAYESVRSLDLSDRRLLLELSARPSRTWRRVFDLSFWMSSVSEVNATLVDRLISLAKSSDFDLQIKLIEQYQCPETGKLSHTFRFELVSHQKPITKEQALKLRSEICSAELKPFLVRV